MKRKILILSAIFALFLIVGLWYNLTPGRYYADNFWRLKDGEYTSWDNRIRRTDDGFELTLGGRELTATLTETDDVYRVDFSDGWAVELGAFDAHISISVGGMMFTGDSTYILTDMDKANLRFGSVVREVRDPFYNEDGEAVGESIYLETETGESVGWHEVWFNQPEMSSPEPETVLLENGARLKSDDFRRCLYVNKDGDYLLNAGDARMLQMSDYIWNDRSSVSAFLVRIAHEAPGRRGEPAVIFLYAFLYLLGAAQFLWPQQLAFFGHRWQFRNEPELSDEGLFMMKLGGVLVMVLGAVLLFVVP